jgi:hypothetical protein
VENLYVDDDKNLQFFDAVTSGVLRLRRRSITSFRPTP